MVANTVRCRTHPPCLASGWCADQVVYMPTQRTYSNYWQTLRMAGHMTAWWNYTVGRTQPLEGLVREQARISALGLEPHRTQPVRKICVPACARVDTHAVYRRSYLHNAFTDSRASTVGANLVWHAGPPTAHRFLDTPVTHAPSPITVGGRSLWPQ